jgi:hypothetical protein
MRKALLLLLFPVLAFCSEWMGWEQNPFFERKKSLFVGAQVEFSADKEFMERANKIYMLAKHLTELEENKEKGEAASLEQFSAYCQILEELNALGAWTGEGMVDFKGGLRLCLAGLLLLLDIENYYFSTLNLDTENVSLRESRLDSFTQTKKNLDFTRLVDEYGVATDVPSNMEEEKEKLANVLQMLKDELSTLGVVLEDEEKGISIEHVAGALINASLSPEEYGLGELGFEALTEDEVTEYIDAAKEAAPIAEKFLSQEGSIENNASEVTLCGLSLARVCMYKKIKLKKDLLGMWGLKLQQGTTVYASSRLTEGEKLQEDKVTATSTGWGLDLGVCHKRRFFGKPLLLSFIVYDILSSTFKAPEAAPKGVEYRLPIRPTVQLCLFLHKRLLTKIHLDIKKYQYFLKRQDYQYLRFLQQFNLWNNPLFGLSLLLQASKNIATDQNFLFTSALDARIFFLNLRVAAAFGEREEFLGEQIPTEAALSVYLGIRL